MIKDRLFNILNSNHAYQIKDVDRLERKQAEAWCTARSTQAKEGRPNALVSGQEVLIQEGK